MIERLEPHLEYKVAGMAWLEEADPLATCANATGDQRQTDQRAAGRGDQGD
jgi:hypothetical protein